MTWGESARRKLKYLLTTEPPKIHEWGQLLAEALDNDCETGQGTLAERPAAKTRGRLYMVQGDATAANNPNRSGYTGWELYLHGYGNVRIGIDFLRSVGFRGRIGSVDRTPTECEVLPVPVSGRVNV